MVRTITKWMIEEKARIRKQIDEAIDKLSAAGLKADFVQKEEDPKRLLAG